MKKKTSKITMPKEAMTKATLHAFRADRELTHLLKTLPNKSEFITKAIMEAFGRDHYITCSTCHGTGLVPKKARA